MNCSENRRNHYFVRILAFTMTSFGIAWWPGVCPDAQLLGSGVVPSVTLCTAALSVWEEPRIVIALC